MNSLKEIRLSKNLTQKDLGKILDVSSKSVSAWELGKRYPRYHTMQKIEDYFGIRKETIFFGAFNYDK